MQVIRDLASMASSFDDWKIVGLAAVSCRLPAWGIRSGVGPLGWGHSSVGQRQQQARPKQKLREPLDVGVVALPQNLASLIWAQATRSHGGKVGGSPPGSSQVAQQGRRQVCKHPMALLLAIWGHSIAKAGPGDPRNHALWRLEVHEGGADVLPATFNMGTVGVHHGVGTCPTPIGQVSQSSCACTAAPPLRCSRGGSSTKLHGSKVGGPMRLLGGPKRHRVAPPQRGRARRSPPS